MPSEDLDAGVNQSESRRSILAGMGTVALSSIAGCSATSQMEEKPTTQTESESKEEWPPEVPKEVDGSVSQWDIGNYSWMTAAHLQVLNSKIDEQNRLLREIRDELRK